MGLLRQTLWRFATRGMNSILHLPNQVSVSPAVSRRTKVATPDKYRLEVVYREGTPAIIYNGVHIAPKLLAALQSPDLDSFNMITLRLLSPATWALKNRPTYLLIGVRDCHGGEVSEVPPVWRGLWRANLIRGLIYILAALLLGGWRHGPMAAALAVWLTVLGTRRLGNAHEVNVKPFTVDSTWSR
jgi:hypothetical protein